MTASSDTRRFNVGEFLPRAATRHPEQKALIFKRGSRYESWTFAQLDARVDGYAHALQRRGVAPRQNVLLMVRGAEFVALTFAVFKLGAVPALIDPGMGLQGVLSCIRQLKPEALVAIRAVHVLRFIYPRSFRSVKHAIVAESLDPRDAGAFPMADTRADETAAILFTSGSTGPAKGVVYRHGIFAAQVEALQGLYEFVPGDVDMPGFPLFALFSTALAQTCVIPELNPSRPATVDAKKVVDAVLEFGANSLQGSPAIWSRVGSYCKERGIRLPSVRRVLTFGAPIAVDLLRTWRDVLPASAQVHTPYGATEALPVASIGSDEILGETAALSARGAGTCVGMPAPGIQARIIRITDNPIAEWHDELLVPQGTVGEIAVSGDVVTWNYDGLPEATHLAKIRLEGRIWHRMGDVGYFDARGRLWFCGRKAHRIEGDDRVWFSVCGEGMVDPHPEVARSALVGVGERGSQEPVLVVEGQARPGLAEEVLGLLHADPAYADVKRVLFHPGFPVDPRHNAKIHREELAAWAAARLGPGPR